MSSKFFCVAPFVHMYAHTTGKVMTCCAGEDGEFGDLKLNTLDEIWHNDKFKQLRKDFIEGNNSELVTKNCATCINFEKSGIHSLRQGLNAEFLDYAEITEDPEINLLYIDFRFNNFCNFKCRGCYFEYSSSIHREQKEDNEDNEEEERPDIIFAGREPDDLYTQTLPHLKYTHKVYFAGGEPLIQWEHWKILDNLIALNRKDVNLVYNTNFSTMKYKGKDIADYWKKFNNVKLLLSIDGMEKGGEYWRHGTDWDKLVNNIKHIKSQCPHVHFGVTCTVGWVNLYSAMDFVDYCCRTGLIDPRHININVLQYPDYYCVQNVPDWKKKELETRITSTLNNYSDMYSGSLLKSNLEGLIKFMWEASNTSCLKLGAETLIKVDFKRNENFFETFPEHLNMADFFVEDEEEDEGIDNE